MQLVSRKFALENGLPRYFTGKPCKHGHVCERIASNWVCVECNRENVKKQAQITPDRVRANKLRSGRKQNQVKLDRREAATGHRWLSQMIRDAVRNKVIFKTPCEVCGCAKVEGHHVDYSKPLQVIWLCRKHHSEVHNGIR